jgi:ribosomal protein L16/L10AE
VSVGGTLGPTPPHLIKALERVYVQREHLRDAEIAFERVLKRHLKRRLRLIAARQAEGVKTTDG